jgi:hypothetical protein
VKAGVGCVGRVDFSRPYYGNGAYGAVKQKAGTEAGFLLSIWLGYQDSNLGTVPGSNPVAPDVDKQKAGTEAGFLLSIWLGYQDSNLGMAGSKPAALPLGDTPILNGAGGET